MAKEEEEDMAKMLNMLNAFTMLYLMCKLF